MKWSIIITVIVSLVFMLGFLCGGGSGDDGCGFGGGSSCSGGGGSSGVGGGAPTLWWSCGSHRVRGGFVTSP